jgi:hypothetical protein
MIVKILGGLDILTGAMILLFQYDVIGIRLLISFILYLLIKGFLFRMNFASFLDIVIAIYMVFMIFMPFTILSYVAAIYLFQKGAVSFFS